ncbi:MAG TPA: GNAT family N-acetyltransferase [Candidatus Dormibacteraeota bacterium]|nr:GNAT family N-acetyltransferase [Candidatus Dormibacteraeota bacterium]
MRHTLAQPIRAGSNSPPKTPKRRRCATRLLSHLQQFATTPILIGTWADASWAIHFYQRHGFRIVPPEKERLLNKYWSIPARQIETSVVLADANWRPATSPNASRALST